MHRKPTPAVERDVDRLRSVYAGRSQDPRLRERYDASNTGNACIEGERRKVLTEVIQRRFGGSLAGLTILDLGCGPASALGELSCYGAEPGRFYGVDLMDDRIRNAQSMHPDAIFIAAQAHSLPFEAAKFDIIHQSVLMSSILSREARAAVAREIDRVLKPGGSVLWYDFWLNPINHEARGVRVGEVRRLFPGYTVDSAQITLAPPLARAAGRFGPTLVALLGKLKPLRTHHLATLTKPR